jgi:hypothetical protein
VRGWVIVGLLLALLVSGCENPYKKYYQPNAGLSPEFLTQRRVAPPPEHPEVYRGNNPTSDLAALMADGYAIIGHSSFNGTAENAARLVRPIRNQKCRRKSLPRRR